MNIHIKAKTAGLHIATFLVFLVFFGLPISAADINSQFFSTDAGALHVIGGTPYNMNDPAWFINISDQNRNIFAYKIFAGLFMLGYQTEMGYMYGLDDSQLRALYAFQAKYGLPVSSVVTSACLQQMDQLLVQRENQLAPIANTFQLYDHMQPLSANDISKDTLATIYTLPMSVLPPALQMSQYEQVQCIAGQCDGFIQDSSGNSLPGWPTPIDLSSDYRFVGAYFDRQVYNSRLPSAAVHVDTVLHEYAHYLDNIFHWAKTPLQPHMGMIDTTGFYNILYDLTSGTYCYTPRSTNPKDWVTKYGFNPGYGGCTNGQNVVFEEWAEAFSMYVAAGRNFRAAAQQRTLIAQQYEWLKNNVFGGLEYDTDLPRDLESGCNDIHGESSAQPGYASCSDSYIWNYTLPILQYSLTINAVGNGPGNITSSTGGIEYTYPTTTTDNVALNSGTGVTLTATAGDDATASWSGNCDVTGGTATAATCTINVRDTAKTVTATFSMTPFNAACGPSDGQTLSATPSIGLCSIGTPGEVSGSGPWSWVCQGVYGGTSAACSADVTKYTLTASASGTGSGTVVASTGGISYSYPTTTGESISLNSGTAVTLTATSDTGSFVTWSGNCSAAVGATAVATCEITSMDGPKTITATFSLIPVNSICGTANNWPFIIAPTTNLCAAGTPTAVIGAGPWTWTCQGLNGGSNTSCSANIQQWKVTPSAVSGGNINPSNYQMVNHNDTKQFSITPDTGYHIASVTGCNGSLVNSTYITGAINADCTITASFTIDTFTLTPSAGANGSISPATPQPVGYNSTQVFTVTPSTGYSITTVTGCGGSLVGNSYTTGPITADCSVTATFSDITAPAIAVSTLSDGSWTNNGTLNVAGTVTDSGSGVKSLMVNNVPLTVDNSTFSTAVSLVSGANTITVMATDVENNSTTDTRTINYDSTPPVINITGPSDNSATNVQMTTISGSVDTNSIVTGMTNNGSPVMFTSNIDGTFSADITLSYGINTIQVNAADMANNNSNAKRTLTYDNVPPSLAITGPSTDINTNHNTITITGTVTDLTRMTVTLSVDGGTADTLIVSDGTFSKDVSFSTEKLYAIEVTATDAANNSSRATRNIIYYATSPVTQASLAGGTYTGTQSVTLSCSDGSGTGCNASFYCLGASCTPTTAYNGPISISSSTDLRFYSTDLSGNAETVETATYTIMHTVTPSAGSNGNISPDIPQAVQHGSTASFTIASNSGYMATVGGTCGGSPATGTSQFNYTTGEIIGDCTVTVTSSLTPVNGLCGDKNNGTFASPPTDDLCSQGTASAVSGSGPWTWTCQGVGDGTTANCSASVLAYVLVVTKGGTGDGTVTADTGSLSWTLNTGTANYVMGTFVNISASADPGSSFTGWTGDCFGNGTPCAIIISSARSVTATFHLLSCDEKLVKISGTCYYYQKIQDAYNLLNDGETLQIQALDFAEDLVLKNNTDVTLEGGYDCNYTASYGVTNLNGSLTIQGGTVTIERLIIE